MVTTMHDLPMLTHGVFWVAIAFFLFIALFGRKLATVALGQLDARIGAIRAELEEATRLRAQAETLLASASAREAEARIEARTLLDSARREAETLTRTLHADAEAAAIRQERMLAERIAAAEAAVVTELRQAAIDLATESTRRILATSVDPAIDATLIDHAITLLPTALRAA